jgi:hypothetical protein
MGLVIGIVIAVVVLIVLVASTVIARRRGYSGIGGNTVVRCSKGHLFTTIWTPGVSLKSIRLGVRRYQHCPVGKHWALVAPVKDADLSQEDREFAAGHHDVRLP